MEAGSQLQKGELEILSRAEFPWKTVSDKGEIECLVFYVLALWVFNLSCAPEWPWSFEQHRSAVLQGILMYPQRWGPLAQSMRTFQVAKPKEVSTDHWPQPQLLVSCAHWIWLWLMENPGEREAKMHSQAVKPAAPDCGNLANESWRTPAHRNTWALASGAPRAFSVTWIYGGWLAILAHPG